MIIIIVVQDSTAGVKVQNITCPYSETCETRQIEDETVASRVNIKQ